MFSLYNPTEDDHRLHIGEATFLIDHNLTKSWDVLLEYAGQVPNQGGPTHLAQMGSAFKLTACHQLDSMSGGGNPQERPSV
jgi:hypothetical protein